MKTRAAVALADGGLDLVVSGLGLPDGSGLDIMLSCADPPLAAK